MYEGSPALAPQYEDLERLYNLIIEKRATTVLEFGCGYSTIVITKALAENKKWFEALPEKPEVRNLNLWECHSIDTNEKWTNVISGLCDATLYKRICCSVGWRNMTCTAYSAMPQITPDFIYIDGPDPNQVIGGYYDMPMSADLLGMEPILIPGTTVLIDGRTNNARFLRRNLQRTWCFLENQEEDYTLMNLQEPRLGKINACGRDILEWIRDNDTKN